MAHNKLKRDLRKGVPTNVDVNINRWECETCGRILLSKAGFVNHQKSHAQQPPGDVLPPRPKETTCVLCTKVCKSIAGLKRHMLVDKAVIPQKDIMDRIGLVPVTKVLWADWKGIKLLSLRILMTGLCTKGYVIRSMEIFQGILLC